jgi:hypothetical protein
MKTMIQWPYENQKTGAMDDHGMKIGSSFLITSGTTAYWIDDGRFPQQ